MKVLKIVLITLLVYVGIVVAFESLIGTLQPASESTIVIITFDADGTAHERVVSKLESDGKMYIAANHWPRAWYTRALENPEMQVMLESEIVDLLAVPVSGAEHARVEGDNPAPLAFRVLTGFPPRYFLRLDPR